MSDEQQRGWDESDHIGRPLLLHREADLKPGWWVPSSKYLEPPYVEAEPYALPVFGPGSRERKIAALGWTHHRKLGGPAKG